MSQTDEYVRCFDVRISVAVSEAWVGSEKVPRARPTPSSISIRMRLKPLISDLSRSSGEKVLRISLSPYVGSRELGLKRRSFPAGRTGLPSRPAVKTSSATSMASSPPSNSQSRRENCLSASLRRGTTLENTDSPKGEEGEVVLPIGILK